MNGDLPNSKALLQAAILFHKQDKQLDHRVVEMKKAHGLQAGNSSLLLVSFSLSSESKGQRMEQLVEVSIKRQGWHTASLTPGVAPSGRLEVC